MPVIPVGFGQATFIYGGDAHPTGAVWTLGFEQISGGGLTASEYAEIFADREVTYVSEQRHTSSILVEVLVKLGPTDTGPTGSFFPNAPGVLAGGESVEPNTAMLVKKVTAMGGRKGRGRAYVPGTADGTFDGAGNISSGTLAAFQVFWTDFYDALNVFGLELVVLHGDATAPTPITALNLDGRAATQRRRLRR